MKADLESRAASLFHYGIIVSDMEYYNRGVIRRTVFENGEIVTKRDGEVINIEREGTRYYE